MEITVCATGRNNSYSATGIFDGHGVRVLSGSRIAPKTAAKIQPVVKELRSNSKIVSSEFILLEDVVFRSPSTAASFVTGNIANGMRVWKLESGKSLGTRAADE